MRKINFRQQDLFQPWDSLHSSAVPWKSSFLEPQRRTFPDKPWSRIGRTGWNVFLRPHNNRPDLLKLAFYSWHRPGESHRECVSIVTVRYVGVIRSILKAVMSGRVYLSILFSTFLLIYHTSHLCCISSSCYISLSKSKYSWILWAAEESSSQTTVEEHLLLQHEGVGSFFPLCFLSYYINTQICYFRYCYLHNFSPVWYYWYSYVLAVGHAKHSTSPPCSFPPEVSKSPFQLTMNLSLFSYKFPITIWAVIFQLLTSLSCWASSCIMLGSFVCSGILTSDQPLASILDVCRQLEHPKVMDSQESSYLEKEKI